LFGLLLGLLLWLVLGPGPWWIVGSTADRLTPNERLTQVNGARVLLVQMLGGLVVVFGLGFTARTYYLSREGQMTDRFAKAVDQLGSATMDVRIGGIFSLERIMRDSAKDHDSIVAVLTAFIRGHGSSGPVGSLPESEMGFGSTAADVQAALTVLGRRPRRKEGHPVDLQFAVLDQADMMAARFPGARFGVARLRGISAVGVNLAGASLIGAHLEGAGIPGSDLRQADLRKANLRSANLKGALLAGAQLQGADLRDAKALTRAQVESAVMDQTTRLPEHLNPRAST
jgi:hypothetical protein